MTNFIDRADTDERAAKFRNIAQTAGWFAVEDTSPWAEGPGIVHALTFNEDEDVNYSDSVFSSWEFCCYATNLTPLPEGREEREYMATLPVDIAPVPASGQRPSYEDLLKTVTMIAAFIKDGDEVDGKEHEMSIDDAFETTHACITMCRDLLNSTGGEPAPQIEGAHGYQPLDDHD